MPANMPIIVSGSGITGSGGGVGSPEGEPPSENTTEAISASGSKSKADVDFRMLGVQFRGCFDFGVALQDYRVGVKMKGKV